MSTLKINPKISYEKQHLNKAGYSGEYEKYYSLDNKYLSFEISDIVYCIKLSALSEILTIDKINEIEGMPKILKGVINLRGKIIPVIDIKMQSDDNVKDYNKINFIIIIHTFNNLLGLKVDNLLNVISLDKFQSENMRHYDYNFQSIGNILDLNDEEKKMILIDADKIIDKNDMEFINKNINSFIRPVIK